MDAFRFYSWLWLLLIPVVVAIVIWRTRRAQQPSAVFSSIADLKGLPVTLLQRIHRWLPCVYGSGLCLLLLAIARPQSGKSESRITGEGIAIELVLDVSGSMVKRELQATC